MNCPGCNKPMVDGQVFNGLLKCHWDCQDQVRANMGQQNADDLIAYRIEARLKLERLSAAARIAGMVGDD